MPEPIAGERYLGVPGERIGAFYGGRSARNSCAQAAVACLLDFWQLAPSGGEGPSELVDRIYESHPPDTPFGLFGTTPGRVEQACRAYGLTTSRWGREDADPRGRLAEALAAREPAIVLVDLHRLGEGWGFHYLVAYGCDAEAVHCTNMLPNPISPEPRQPIPWSLFMRAWRSWLPGPALQCMGIRAWK
jgi:hypothetical protein